VEICKLNLLVYEVANGNKRFWYFSPFLTRRALKKRRERRGIKKAKQGKTPSSFMKLLRNLSFKTEEKTERQR
jgi:hypothetical protein